MVERTIQRLMEKQVRIYFYNTWFVVVVKKVNDKFHNKIVASFKAHLLEFKDVNLGFTS
jgi:hypothetical protein